MTPPCGFAVLSPEQLLQTVPSLSGLPYSYSVPPTIGDFTAYLLRKVNQLAGSISTGIHTKALSFGLLPASTNWCPEFLLQCYYCMSLLLLWSLSQLAVFSFSPISSLPYCFPQTAIVNITNNHNIVQLLCFHLIWHLSHIWHGDRFSPETLCMLIVYHLSFLLKTLSS